jgi:REP element-mobilizing transposase RayT
MTPLHPVTKIVQTWKSFSAREINRVLGRQGALWQGDYFDRLLRNEDHFARSADYIENNPVRAGLCPKSESWRFGSGYLRTTTEVSRRHGP